jgi:hypothetical protein
VATVGPCLRARLSICFRCFGGRRRHKSQAVSAIPSGPARRPRRSRGTAVSSHSELLVVLVALSVAVPVSVVVLGRVLAVLLVVAVGIAVTVTSVVV